MFLLSLHATHDYRGANLIILLVNKVAAASPSPTFDLSYRDAVDDLTLKLEGWYDNLPLQLQDTHANLARYAELGLGPMFVAVYVSVPSQRISCSAIPVQVC